jgi:transposase
MDDAGMTRTKPEIIEVNSQQMEELLDRATSNTLGEEDIELMGQIFDSYAQFFRIVEDKNTSLARLRKLLFGVSSEKTNKVVGGDTRASDANASDDEVPPSPEGAGGNPTGDKPPAAGHGRHSADDYSGAEQVTVPHASLSSGDTCPECSQGTLYEKAPSVLVRFVGQAPLQATVYRMQKLRCHLCGKVFTASLPDEAGQQKYDHSVASMIGLLKYGSGLPFNRLQRLQQNFEIPLAASTQWDIVEAAAMLLLPAYDELIRQAAQGEVVHNDDTTVRILELMGERARKTPPDPDEHDPRRSGLFTSGVVATRAGVRMALFFSGRRHAGENLSQVLKHRSVELDAPIHMCDGLARNIPQDLETILSNCLAHARRRFVDIYDRFTAECRHIIEALKVVYHHDQEARQQALSAEERLAYHQAHSQPVMDDLRAWLQRQLDEKQVEPNSALGEAMSYMLKRWGRLTLFLRKAGAPLDNNTCERMLKKAILHRKNAMFFKSRNGARVGDMYMSLIHTCELAGVNAFDYLNQLQINSAAVNQKPEQWMPWNYTESLPLNSEAA